MAMMGVHSVAYHEENVAHRADDHSGAALAYYGSRGETPLVWGGSGAAMLGVSGEVTHEAYRAVFAEGGACLPRTGARLVSTRRPGMELVVSPPKSVAELGVIGRAEDMHSICDAERNATMAYLDGVFRKLGGRRGEAEVRTATAGLTWATSRHATTREGDPQVHDHVLVANVVWMRDSRGGWKALDTALLRDQLHAATAVGRLAAARKAVELGYSIVPDWGRSGKLGGWQIAGIPDAVMEVHSKRTRQIDERAHTGSYRSRNVAARLDRRAKDRESVGELTARWRAELADAGHPIGTVVAAVDDAGRDVTVPGPLTEDELAEHVEAAFDAWAMLTARKVFTRAEVIVAVAPLLHGRPVSELDRVADAVIADVRCVPLLGVAGVRTQAYATAATLASEARLAAVAGQLASAEAAEVTAEVADTAVAGASVALNGGQESAAMAMLTSGAGLELLVGVAGSGKTTCLAAVRAGFEAAGYTVIGTATSGQAARGLGDGAGIESRTVASLLWRLDHDHTRLTKTHVLVLDEAGMTDDPDLTRLLLTAQKAGAKVIIAGDDRQLGAVGPGGGLGALITRQPDQVHRLGENVRQANPAERAALAELRAGDVETAVGWYAANDRIRSYPTADETIDAIVAAWGSDVAAGLDTVLLAWRRADVAELNDEARAAYGALGRLHGPEIEAPGGARYARGDQIVMLTPGPGGTWVTSERATVTRVSELDGSIDAVTADGRDVHLDRMATDADRLAHAYAMTAHRTQGATVDTAHVLEDGGGRELAYVAMSRARQRSRVYLTADGPDEALDQLAWAWGAERRQHWATDQGRPSPTATPPGPSAELRAIVDELAAVAAERRHLLAATGPYATGPVADAAANLASARDGAANAQSLAVTPGLRRRAGRAADAQLVEATDALRDAEAAWAEVIAPHLARLDARSAAAKIRLDDHRDAQISRRWRGQAVDAQQRAGMEDVTEAGL